MAVTKKSTPGVYGKEIDISEVVIPAGTSSGGIVIRAPKGPINRIKNITTDKDYIDTFGEPVFTSGTNASMTPTSDESTPEYGFGSYASLEFLNESNDLNVIRIANDGDQFAAKVFDRTNATTSAVTITADTTPSSLDTSINISDVENATWPDTTSASNNLAMVAALGPGTDGNNIGILFETFSSACDWRYAYDDYADVSADGSPESDAIAPKVVKMSVYTKKSSESFPATTNLSAWDALEAEESFYGTFVSQLDSNDKQLKLTERVNGVSDYVYLRINSTIAAAGNMVGSDTLVLQADDTTAYKKFTAAQLADGVSVAGTGLGSTAGWSFFKDKENVDVSILILPDYSMSVKTYVNDKVVNKRKDCILVTQSGERNDDTVSQVLEAETYGYVAPSYVALYAGWDYVYDSYNDRKLYLPKCIFGAAIMARTDNVANVWDAPAGMNRGIIPALTQNKIFTFSQIGQLYDRNINTSRMFRGIGHVMWGQKTAQMKASARDRINVRRLLLYLEKTIEGFLRPYVLDVNNTEKVRLRIWSQIDSFLAGVKAEDGLIAYDVVCDTTNNTPVVIDNNQLNVDVYVQPPKTIEFIDLQTIVTSTGVNFAEIRVR